MSNTKWRKLIAALDRPDLQLNRCVIKFVGEPETGLTYRPNKSTLYHGGVWIDFGQGPVLLSIIEWIMFPRRHEWRPRDDRTLPAKTADQEVDRAARILAELGDYPVELTEEGLLVRGHLAA